MIILPMVQMCSKWKCALDVQCMSADVHCTIVLNYVLVHSFLRQSLSLVPALSSVISAN